MGGGHAIYTGLVIRSLFSVLGIFSPGLPRHFDAKFGSILAQPEAFNKQVRTVWVACGKGDSTVQYPRVKSWEQSLEKAEIHSSFKTYAGAHTWPVWRFSLADFAPVVFEGPEK